MLKWFDTREATAFGTELADDFVVRTARLPTAARSRGRGEPAQQLQAVVQMFLQRVDRDARPLKLSLVKRASLANSFKWRLLDKGVEPEVADELTRALLLRLSGAESSPSPGSSQTGSTRSVDIMMAEANRCMGRGAYEEAAAAYELLLNHFPREAQALNNLGAALSHLGRPQDAETTFRRAIGIRPSYADAHCNLGASLSLMGRDPESETSLRRALKLKPAYPEAHVNLGATLISRRRFDEAASHFEKALRVSPRNVGALLGMGRIAAQRGKFTEAEDWFRRALDVEPNCADAWAGLAGQRRLSPADRAWLKGVEAALAAHPTPAAEMTLRYALGKYHDDVGDYARAFKNYQRGNELQKRFASPYDPKARSSQVDALIAAWPREALERARPGASDSQQPVFVVGMMRSGTTLVTQILASHPACGDAREREFWPEAARKRGGLLSPEQLDDAEIRKLSAAYLRELGRDAPHGLRAVDKTTFNADLLGPLHAIFPNARIIYLQRDPIDTCLSCYFQQLSPTLNYALDLTDLAHYYREHQRLMSHWRSVLPPESLLIVPYAELTAEPEHWARRIVEFVGLAWDHRCLEFYKTERTVSTASFWQVRQLMYRSSVGRWHNYQKFIGPLLSLRA